MFGTRKAAHTIVASDMRIQGQLEGDGDITIDGRVEGDVRSGGQVAVGPEGTVTGDIAAHHLTVSGRVDGSVRVAGRLHVQASGRVSGELQYQSLQVECGGRVEGNARVLAEESGESSETEEEPTGERDGEAVDGRSKPVAQA